MPRHAVVLGAGGAARAVLYTLITEGFQRVVIFNRHLHRGEALVRHFGRSASHMDLRAMPWHESVLEAELAKTKLVVNATSVGHAARRDAHPGAADPAGPAGHGSDLQPARSRSFSRTRRPPAAAS